MLTCLTQCFLSDFVRSNSRLDLDLTYSYSNITRLNKTVAANQVTALCNVLTAVKLVLNIASFVEFEWFMFNLKRLTREFE